MIDEACLFRGQRQSDWLVDSTFARSLKSLNGVKTTERYLEDVLASVAVQHEFARIWLQKFYRVQLSPQLQQFRSQEVDRYFEAYRHQQQNPNAPHLTDISPFGTNFIDCLKIFRLSFLSMSPYTAADLMPEAVKASERATL
jgi:hypothetical protein